MASGEVVGGWFQILHLYYKVIKFLLIARACVPFSTIHSPYTELDLMGLYVVARILFLLLLNCSDWLLLSKTYMHFRPTQYMR